MKILVVTQYFWPEKFRVNDFVLGLKEKGHDVIVFTGKPNYPVGTFFAGYSFFGRSNQIWNGISIFRSPLIPRGRDSGFLLFLNYISFAFFGSIMAFFKKIDCDVIIAYQQSPVTAALPAIVYKWKCKKKMFLYIQDLWPESVTAITNIKNRSVINVLSKITEWIYTKSDYILIQSRAFKEFLKDRNVQSNKIFYLPNSTDAFYKKVTPSPALNQYFSEGMNIVFAGNIGEAQSFETIVEAAKIVVEKERKIHWIIIGDGRKRDAIEQLVTKMGLNDVIRFIGSFEPEMMPDFFAKADALLISLKKDFIFSITIPSKLQSYLACAKPIIGSLDGEGKKIIEDAQCGLTSGAEDAIGLAENVLKFYYLTTQERAKFAENALLYFEKEFNRDKLINLADKIFKENTTLI